MTAAPSQLTALIIDDEPLARDIIRTYLEAYPAVRLLGECENGFEGLKAIQELKPDLIFLDVQMPKITGFEMLELLEHAPLIVFSTAFNQFALAAFEQNAVDYLLKPYSRDRFAVAMEKVLLRFRQKTPSTDTLQHLIAHVRQHEGTLERVVVKTGNKIKVIPVESIRYVEAQDDYVLIHAADGKHLKQWTMKYLEEHLDVSQFIRVHRSFLVRIAEIAQLDLYEKGTYLLALKNGGKLPVSQAGHARLKEVLRF